MRNKNRNNENDTTSHAPQRSLGGTQQGVAAHSGSIRSIVGRSPLRWDRPLHAFAAHCGQSVTFHLRMRCAAAISMAASTRAPREPHRTGGPVRRHLLLRKRTVPHPGHVTTETRSDDLRPKGDNESRGGLLYLSRPPTHFCGEQPPVMMVRTRSLGSDIIAVGFIDDQAKGMNT